jgi:hypothetical protein
MLIIVTTTRVPKHACLCWQVQDVVNIQLPILACRILLILIISLEANAFSWTQLAWTRFWACLHNAQICWQKGNALFTNTVFGRMEHVQCTLAAVWLDSSARCCSRLIIVLVLKSALHRTKTAFRRTLDCLMLRNAKRGLRTCSLSTLLRRSVSHV